jgi:diadenosine tetraphosphate (Ap4A) HIT family hydrolase
MKKCVFCSQPEIQERTIVKNDLVFAFPTNIPITPGHTLICPVRCVSAFEDMTNDEKEGMFELTRKVKTALRKSFGAVGFHHAWNEGSVAGQSVPHFHLHIVPRSDGDSGITEYEPRKFLYRPGSRNTVLENELRDIAELMRETLRHE